MGLELAEQLGWRLPDAVFYPTGGGVGIIGMWKAFDELERLGWISSKRPKMIAVQAAGCAPIVKAYEEGAESSEFWQDAATVASGLRVPRRWGDFLVLKAVRESGGTAVAVSDGELLEAGRILAEAEGSLRRARGRGLRRRRSATGCPRVSRQKRRGRDLQHRNRLEVSRSVGDAVSSRSPAGRAPRRPDSSALDRRKSMKLECAPQARPKTSAAYPRCSSAARRARSVPRSRGSRSNAARRCAANVPPRAASGSRSRDPRADDRPAAARSRKRPAPPRRSHPPRSAAVRSSKSTIAPRPMLMSTALGFMRANSGWRKSPAVCGVCGAAITT